MKLPDPPLLVITDRRQARRPLSEVVAAVLAALKEREPQFKQLAARVARRAAASA